MATAVSEAVAVRTRTRVPLPPKLRAPGWYRAAMFEVARPRLRVRHHRADPLAAAHPSGGLRERRDDGRTDRRAAVLHRRDRRLRLLGVLGDRAQDPARGPLLPRSPQLARLLPRQHRPQGDRDPVHGHLVLLPVRRRPAGDADPRPARQAGDAVPDPRAVQRRLLRPRHGADLPVRDPGVRGARELRAAADDRRAGHGVPAPERLLVLAAADGRRADADELPRARRLVRLGLDRLRAAVDDDAAGADVLHRSGCSSPASPRSSRRSTSWSRSSRCVRPG